MKKDLAITMEEECIDCPMLSLVTSTLDMGNGKIYKVHRCEHVDFCKVVRNNWEKHRKEDNDE